MGNRKCPINDYKKTQMKKLYFSVLAVMAMLTAAHAQITLTTQFINPCGNDARNEFTVAKTGANGVNIADIIFGSYNPTNSSGDAVVNYNYWWRGTNAVSSPYPTFTTTTTDVCGTSGINCYGFLYPSIPADAADIATLLDTLNSNAGCTVFLSVPASNIIPANSNVIFFLGAGHRTASGLCGFDSSWNFMNFRNHCSNGAPIATYYAVFGNANANNASCTDAGGYFSNSSRRVSALHTWLGGDTLVATNYNTSLQDYDPGNGVVPGSAGLIVPDGTGGTTWINNQGCIPLASTVLAIRFDYFTAVLFNNNKGLIKWRSSYEENINNFIVEKSLNGKDFVALTHVNPKNISGSEYSTIDEKLATGTNFYRLKVINMDGTVDYSPIVRINFKKGTPSGWYVYPNPAQGDAAIQYQTITAKEITVNITDVAGKLISTSVHNIAAGNNKIAIPSHRMSRGMYMVTIFSEGLKETSSFIKK
jgi:hypothetical protein